MSFEIQPGETVALVGPSGAGKSSIIQLIEHFYTTKAGKILLDQTPVEKFNHEYYHQRVALVAQEPVIFIPNFFQLHSYSRKDMPVDL